jgi:integrase
MSDELVLVLLRHKAAQEKLRKQVGEDWVESNRVFSEWNGAPMSPNRPYNMLRRLLEKNGLPAVSLHSLRHTNATLMIQSGTDIRTTSERLGHSKTSTTMDIYVHQIKSANEHAAANLSAALAFEEGA